MTGSFLSSEVLEKWKKQDEVAAAREARLNSGKDNPGASGTAVGAITNILKVGSNYNVVQGGMHNNDFKKRSVATETLVESELVNLEAERAAQRAEELNSTFGLDEPEM